jgi:hypothetical protein
VTKGIDTIQNIQAFFECLKNNGYEFICRYYSRTTQMPEKVLHQPEAQAISNAGFSIVSVYEDDPVNAAYFSAGRGSEDAAGAQTQATAVGQPAGTPIYFTVDYDAQPGDLPAILQYFTAVRQTINQGGNGPYPVGVYGSGLVCQSLLGAGLVEFTWLSQSGGFNGTADFKASNQWNLLQELPANAPQPCGDFDYDPDVSQGNGGGWTL